MTPGLFVDREHELAELRRLADRGKPTIVLIYGRRRVGKTYLLEHAWEGRRVFYFLAADATAELNRTELIRELSTWSGQQLDPHEYPTWRTIFRLLADQADDQPLIVVLDEFQYLMGGKDDIASQLVAIFDRELRGRPILLALCGSSVGMMEGLLHGGQAIFGRSGWAARIDRFDYRDTARMVPERPAREAALVYGIFGGTPRYLAAIEPDEPLAAAVVRTILSPRGEINLQLAHILEQETGIRKVAEYNAILAAIAAGDIQVGPIAASTGIDVDSVRVAIRTLEELGYVRRERNFGASRTAVFQHRIDDNALNFWFRFVHPARSLLEIADPAEVWRRRIEPHLNTHMGRVFESICREAFSRYHVRWDLPMAVEWSRWEGRDRSRRSIEIDIVARLDDGRILAGEAKWSSKPVDAAPLFHLQRNLEDLANSGYSWAHDAISDDRSARFIFFSAAGFTPEMQQRLSESGHLALTLDDLYPAD